MSATTLMATVLLAQSAFSLGLDSQPVANEEADVGYQELEAGQPGEAIAKIEANAKLESDDPAALINLGNAYARLGQTDKAFQYYRAAADSQERYELELSDGRWMDSRRAAQLALTALKRSTEHAFND